MTGRTNNTESSGIDLSFRVKITVKYADKRKVLTLWFLKLHGWFCKITEQCDMILFSPVSYHVVNALNRNALGVERYVNERQQSEIDRQSNHGDVLLQDKWTYHNGECCMPGNSNIYCDLNHDFYENNSGFLGDGSGCDGCRIFFHFIIVDYYIDTTCQKSLH